MVFLYEEVEFEEKTLGERLGERVSKTLRLGKQSFQLRLGKQPFQLRLEKQSFQTSSFDRFIPGMAVGLVIGFFIFTALGRELAEAAARRGERVIRKRLR